MPPRSPSNAATMAATPSCCRARCTARLAQAGLLTHRRSAQHPGAVARSGAAGGRRDLAASASRHDRCAGVRRDRSDRGAPWRRRASRPNIPLGPVAAPRGARDATRRYRKPPSRKPGRWRCAGRWCRAIRSRPARNARRCAASSRTPRGFADTGYPCRADRDNAELSITGPPPGIVSVGGYRFRLDRIAGAGEPDAIQRPSLPPCPTRWPAIGWPAARWSAPRLRQTLDALGDQSAGQRRLRPAPPKPQQPDHSR